MFISDDILLKYSRSEDRKRHVYGGFGVGSLIGGVTAGIVTGSWLYVTAKGLAICTVAAAIGTAVGYGIYLAKKNK